MVIVDGYNVIGSVPDGWWRDRPAAVRRLLARLVCFRREVDAEVVLVLDVVQRGLPAGEHDGVEVCYPRRPGRNAADGKILELLDLLRADASGSHDTDPGEPVDGAGAGGGHDVKPERPGHSIEVVTSDRALAASAADAGAFVTGARTFLARLDDSGC